MFKKNAVRILPALIIILSVGAVSAAAQTKLLRFPDISGDRVVFTYGGDIWTAPADGGSAMRLTAHPGMEVFGEVFSGRKVDRFHRTVRRRRTGLCGSLGGGVPRQLTFYPAKGPFTPRWGWDNQVYGW